MHVLDFDRRIVHQNADGKGHAAEGHYVDRVTNRPEQDAGRQDGERN